MAKQFTGLAERAKAGWSDETRTVYEAAAAQFTAELAAQAELGRQLTAAREQRQLSQQALQTRTGIQQSEISRIERGIGNPTTATLLRLAEALGVKLSLLPVEQAAAPSPTVQAHPQNGALRSEDDAASRRRNELAAIRQWANANGYTVSSRGRIASSVIDAYQQQQRTHL